MTSEQRTAHPEILYRGRQALEKIQRFPGSEFPYGNLAGAFDTFIDTRGVIFIAGLPRSGKSYSVNHYNSHTENFNIGKPTSSRQPFGNVLWEQAENKARERRLVTTPNEEPFSLIELRRCNEVARELVSIAIDTYDQVTFEAPAITYDSDAIRSYAKGRDIGTSTVDSFVYKKTKWFEAAPDFEVRGIGLIGGPLMQIIMTYYRGDMKNSRSFEEGQEIAYSYGRPIPEDREDWQKRKDEGASPKQIQVIEHSVDILLNRLEREEKIPSVSEMDVDLFFREYIHDETQTLGLSPDIVKRALRRELRTERLTEYKFKQWGVLPKLGNGGIFFNNPRLEDLEIPDLSFLKRRFQQSPIAA